MEYYLLAVVFCVNYLMGWEPGQGISLGVSLSRAMCEAKVEAGQVCGPSGLPSTEVLSRTPIPKVRVVCDDLKWCGEAFQEMSPVL